MAEMPDAPEEPPAPRPERPETDDPEEGPNPFGPVPLLILLVLIAVGFFVAFRLKSVSNVQDCIMSGREELRPGRHDRRQVSAAPPSDGPGVVGRMGLEPMTYGLKVRSSTD